MFVNLDNNYALVIINDLVCSCVPNQEDRNLYNNMYKTMVETGLFDKIFSSKETTLDLNKLVQDDCYKYCQIIEEDNELFNKCVETINKNQSEISGTTLYVASYMINDDDSPYKFLVRNTEAGTSEGKVA